MCTTKNIFLYFQIFFRWSFGVLLFEIFSIGETPYKNVENMKMLLHLKDGKRLEKPDLCSEQL
jgi:hypothetical protein